MTSIGSLWKLHTKTQGCHFTWKYLEFDILGEKNLEKSRIWEILKKNLEF